MTINKVRKNKLLDEDYQRDLAIKIVDYVWYDYLKITGDYQDYDFHMQDTVLDIIKKHMKLHTKRKGVKNG